MNNKLILAGTVQPEAALEAARCTAVQWVPRSDGMFAVAFASGSIYVYKKVSDQVGVSSQWAVEVSWQFGG